MDIRFGIHFVKNQDGQVVSIVTLKGFLTLDSVKIESFDQDGGNQSVRMTKGANALFQFDEATDPSTLTDVQKALAAFYINCIAPFVTELNTRWADPSLRKGKEIITEVGGEMGMTWEQQGVYEIPEKWGELLISAFEANT